MATLKERCERVRDEIPLETFFAHMGWDYREKGRIHCIWPDHEDRSPAMQVYPETQSVHCFACNQGGDVIKMARRCAAPEDGAWSVEEAVDWLEITFGLSKFAAPVKVADRMGRKIKAWRGRGAVSLSEAPLDAEEARRNVEVAFREVESRVPHRILQAASPHRDYVLEQFTPYGNVVEWAAWARSHVFGSYASFLKRMAEPHPVPPDVIDDRPETVRAARLWDTHRGMEFSSSWPVYV